MRSLSVKIWKASSQQGYALLLIMVTMLTIAAVYLVKSLGNKVTSLDQQVTALSTTATNSETLLAAKQALLNYVLTNGTIVNRLGNLPVPDSLVNGIYDGSPDTACLSTGTNGLPQAATNSDTQRCLGKFPWNTLLPAVGAFKLLPSLETGLLAHDPLGQVPWLAISANVAEIDNCVQMLNSDLIKNLTYDGVCHNGLFFTPPVPPTSLSHKWLTVNVFDASNNVISSQIEVAAVLILPGSALTTQNGYVQTRTAVAPGNPKDYLDNIILPFGCAGAACTAYDNAGLNNTFVQIPEDTKDLTTGAKIPFNDVLIYITKDELIAYMEKRVANEMASALRTFKTSTGSYPWAAPFVNPTSYSNFLAQSNTISGLFPFFPTSVGAGSFPTTFGWAMPNASTPARSCVAISGTRYVDSRQLIRSNISALKTSATSSFTGAGSCTWKGTNNVVCSYTGTSPAVTVNMTRYTNNTCTSSTTTRPYSLARTVIFTADANCSSPMLSYSAATAGDNARWSWVCSSPSTTYKLEITDSGTSLSTPALLPFTGNATVTGIGSPPVTVSSMLYQPVMPNWYFDQEWYKTAFYAVAPASAPATPSPNPCGSTTTLTAGATTSIAALAIQAGQALNATARPNATLSNYLESPNSTGGTNCTFAGSNKAHTTTYNDTVSIPK